MKPGGDEEFMRRALRLAKRGFGKVSPNPLVGCVIARGGRVLGEGYHLYAGRHHAEVIALGRAGKGAREATLYVTLEPCAHQGRTPPCADAIIAAGVHRVVAAVEDPNPLTQGRGFSRLRRAGIVVEQGLLQEEAVRLNDSFFHFKQTDLPFGILKLALTLDGRIATRSGDSSWITGSRARLDSHRLRYGSDAILVGIGTVLADDPSLDVRWRRRNSISKIVLDSELRTPPDARLFASGDRVLLFHDADLDKTTTYPKRCEKVPVRRDADGLDWLMIQRAAAHRGIQSVIVEGGRQVAASALKSGVVQKGIFYYSPKVIGADGLEAIGPLGIDSLSDAFQGRILAVRRIGEDLRVEVEWTHPDED